jgi:hypothetical protein
MLIAKGYSVSFKMIEGGTVRGGAGAALLHDPSGKTWPSCSGLVASFKKGLGPIKNNTAEEYLGMPALRGEINLPPRRLSEWSYVGEIAVVNYRRIGKHASPFYHPIEGGKAKLYRWRGRVLRMELGSGCVWNWRGIVTP